MRSPLARGRILGIHFEPNVPWEEITVVTAKDIPGKNCISLLIDDQPCLAAEFVNHPEEPVVLLAHPDKYLLEEARRAVRIEVEPLPAVYYDRRFARPKGNRLGQRQYFQIVSREKRRRRRGMGRRGFDRRRRVRDRRAGATLHRAARNDRAGERAEGVTVWGSLQCPYYVHKALMPLFGLPKDRIRVVQTETGGGFGGKEEYPSMIAAHAALLAWKSGKPVKIIYDRAEDMVATTKRHPSRTHHRTAVTRDGKLLAMDIDFTIDGGAYETLVTRRAFARNDSRRGALQLPERANSKPCGGDECAAARSVSRIWRAAERFCAGAASGSRGGSRGARAGRIAPKEFHSSG